MGPRVHPEPNKLGFFVGSDRGLWTTSAGEEGPSNTRAKTFSEESEGLEQRAQLDQNTELDHSPEPLQGPELDQNKRLQDASVRQTKTF